MKTVAKVFTLFLLFIAFSVAQPKISVSEDTYDFGSVKQGTVVKHVFKIKNTGNKDLILTSVRASCGCTTPHWTNKPIKPGGTGEIAVEFNTAGKMGKQVKTITINSNAEPPTKVLYLKGEVHN